MAAEVATSGAEWRRESVVTSSDPEMDKAARFGPGPWQDEPDRVEWRYAMLPCLIVRNRIGALCGYVGVSEGHPWHGRDYNDLEPGVEVHGGLTFAGECHGMICHVPREGESDHVWWLGFDCAHAHDLMPELVSMRAFEEELRKRSPRRAPRDDTYRDVAYVMDEVESLARQARAVATGASLTFDEDDK